ncbi:MAG: VWA domain-containing protein [Candidatus Omnitrophica bacterium]|nr:VWA domain-containing protein [Candidatus Omnitrophota bacterium]
MRFAQPLVLYALLGVPFLVALLAVLAKHRRKVVSRLAPKELSGKIIRGFDPRFYTFKNILLCLAIIFSIVAMARPQWGFEWMEMKRRGLDIILVIDTSKSMLTEDVKPNRLERTKLAVKDLIKKLKGDRIGLIAFSGDAFLVCPLTVDYSGFLLSLDDLSTETIPRGGTNIDRAIQEAIKGYREVPSQYKAVVVVTDGENWEGDPLHWAKVASEQKIRIYTVGIGTKDGEMIRVPNDKGEMEFLKDKDGNFVKSRLNEPLLKEIAAATGGGYARASGAEFGLDYLYDNELSKMEKRDIESQMDKRYDERFQIPLFLALMMLLAETLMPARKP